MSDTLILSGKDVSSSVFNDLRKRITFLKKKSITPGLAVVLVGNDLASHLYVRSKSRKFNQLELFSETFFMDNDTPEEELLDLISNLNENEMLIVKTLADSNGVIRYNIR